MNLNSPQNFNQEMESLESEVISDNNREIHYSDSVKSCPPKRSEENNDEDNREKKQENNDKEKRTKIQDNVEITKKDDIMIYKNPSGEKTTKDNSTLKKGRRYYGEWAVSNVDVVLIDESEGIGKKVIKKIYG